MSQRSFGFVYEVDKRPFKPYFLDAEQQELSGATGMLDLYEDWLDGDLAPPVGGGLTHPASDALPFSPRAFSREALWRGVGDTFDTCKPKERANDFVNAGYAFEPKPLKDTPNCNGCKVLKK